MWYFFWEVIFLKKYEIVKKNTDFNDIINTGRRIKNKDYYIYYKDNASDNKKFGLAVSKKCGNAVQRNKIKRQMRMIIDNNKDLFFKGFDYIIIVSKKIKEIPYSEMEESLKQLMKGYMNEKN